MFFLCFFLSFDFFCSFHSLALHDSLFLTLTLSSSLYLFLSHSFPCAQNVLLHWTQVKYTLKMKFTKKEWKKKNRRTKWLGNWKWYLQNSTNKNSLSLIAALKLACVSTKTPFSTLGFDSASHRTKPNNANMHVVTVNKNIFVAVVVSRSAI